MKKQFLLAVWFLSSVYAFPQLNCQPNVFYGLSASNEIYSMTLVGTTVTNNGVLIPAHSTNIYALASATDLMSGSGQTFLYSSIADSIIYFNGTTWQNILHNSIVNHNAGGLGNFLYYHHDTPLLIRRFDGTSLNTVFLDSNLYMSVADIAVAPSGNFFFFTGQSANSQFLYEMSSSGTILQIYPLVFNSGNAYGTFVMNGVIYVGVGPSGSPPNSLLPVMISGSTATMGAPISMPAINFKDLATCMGEGGTGLFSSTSFSPNVLVYPNPASEILYIELAGSANGRIELMNVSGQTVLQASGSERIFSISVDRLPAGIYIAKITVKDQVFFRKVEKL